MKIIRNIVKINEYLCKGCGQCVLDCAEGAIRIENGKAKVIADMLCDGLGACLSGCPTGALSIEQRAADPFTEEAVHKHLQQQKHLPQGTVPLLSSMGGVKTGGCPGAKAERLSHNIANTDGVENGEALGGIAFVNETWPVKLRLLSAETPFLKNAHLLVAADCAACASPVFHNELRTGKVVMTACPKFEDKDALHEKLLQIFTIAKPESVTVARMEVPCCSPLAAICMDAAIQSGVEVHSVIIARTGELVEEPFIPAKPVYPFSFAKG